MRGGAPARVILALACVVFLIDGPNPWRGGRNYGWDDNIMTNLIAAFFLFMPAAATFLGGWLGYGMYYLVKAPKESATQPLNRVSSISSGLQTPET